MSRYQSTEGQKLTVEKNMKRAVQLAQSFASLPEVACSTNNVVEENCIDIEKVKLMNNLSESESSYYFDLFKFGKVSVEYFNMNYEHRDNEDLLWSDEFIIYNFPKHGSSYSTIPVPMMVLEPESGQVHFGIMSVTFYEN